VPRHVAASAGLLAKACKQYVFVSSISAYADGKPSGITEAAAVATVDDPTTEKVNEHYGALKALCEQAAEKAFPGRTTNVRPGFIVGAKDASNRFAYWPARISKGGKVLAPPRQDPIQVIDVRDLAEFLVHCVENETMGLFNAVGPGKVLTMGELLDACVEVTGGKAEIVCADGDFLAAQQADGLPIWTHPGSEHGGFGAVSNAKAVAAGMRFRPLRDTVRATWEWWNGISEPAKAAMWDTKRTGRVSAEREAEVVEAWLARDAKKDGKDAKRGEAGKDDGGKR
jgi:2'-hydroxyisoflavone reductase